MSTDGIQRIVSAIEERDYAKGHFILGMKKILYMWGLPQRKLLM